MSDSQNGYFPLGLTSLESVTVSDSKWSEYQETKWDKRPCRERNGFFASYACLYSFADSIDYRVTVARIE